jgi:tagatose 6-phosphate kinase
MILCIGPTPAAQRVMVFRKLTLDAVNRAVTTLDGAAGKSVNVAKVTKALGENPVAVGFLGGPRGEAVREILEAQGIELDFVNVAAPTRQCITVIDQSAGNQTELVEESQAVTSADYESLLAIIRRRVNGCRAVVMSGTITPGGPADFYFRCTNMAHEAGAITVVDAQGAALLEALKAGPGLVKPNRPELQATVGRELGDDAASKSAMRELHERGAQRVVVTAGKEPALAFDGRTFWRVFSPAIQAVNPIGSGDAFTAGLVCRLLRGEDLGEACRWASAAGAANALTLMAGEVRREDFERLAKEVKVIRDLN